MNSTAFLRMGSTRLKLLTSDGVVYVTFVPSLDAEQQRELAVIACLPNTTAELRARLREAGNRWGRKVEFGVMQAQPSV
jgi:hypothetical protein